MWITIVTDQNLDQLKLEPTRMKNILELVFLSRPDITSCTTGPGISCHDHLVIVRGNTWTKQNKKKPCIIHLFRTADLSSENSTHTTEPRTLTKTATGPCSRNAGRRPRVSSRQLTGSTWTHCSSRATENIKAYRDASRVHGKACAE